MDAARFEHKFIVPAAARAELVARCGAALRPDTLGADDGRYPVVSLYCDTPDRRCHWEAWRGVPSRRKLRVRVYGSAGGAIPPACFIEIKHKDGDEGAKRRVALPLADALALVRGGDATAATPAEARVLAEARALVRDDGFGPACVVRYDRQAFFFDAGADLEPLRLTFDTGVRARFDRLEPEPDDRGCGLEVLPPGLCLLEVKGVNAVPPAFAAHLAAFGLAPRSFSKYAEAVRRSGLLAAA